MKPIDNWEGLYVDRVAAAIRAKISSNSKEKAKFKVFRYYFNAHRSSELLLGEVKIQHSKPQGFSERKLGATVHSERKSDILVRLRLQSPPQNLGVVTGRVTLSDSVVLTSGLFIFPTSTQLVSPQKTQETK